MPVVQIDMLEGRRPEQKKKLIEEVTRVFCEALGCKPEVVHVIIRDMPEENWGSGGRQGG